MCWSTVCRLLPLYPGTGFPAWPAGGVSEFPNPMHEEVMAEPVSGGREAEKEEHEDSCLCRTPVTFRWKPWRALNVRCDAKILTRPPCFFRLSRLLAQRAWAAASVSSINLHNTELWQLLWAQPQPGCAPLPAESCLFVAARKQHNRSGSVSKITSEITQRQTSPEFSICLRKTLLFSRWALVLFLGVNRENKDAAECFHLSLISFISPIQRVLLNWCLNLARAQHVTDGRKWPLKRDDFNQLFYFSIIFHICLSADSFCLLRKDGD